MREQLEYIAELSALPNVTIQVLPFAVGGHPAMTTPYVILSFPDPDDNSVVYLDNLTVGIALEEPGQVEGYALVHQKLCDIALTPEQSVLRMRDAAGDMS
jgi:hypothetical protein